MKTILCPMIDSTYDTDIQLETNEILPYYKRTGTTDFALLDALSLEYYGTIELH